MDLSIKQMLTDATNMFAFHQGAFVLVGLSVFFYVMFHFFSRVEMKSILARRQKNHDYQAMSLIVQRIKEHFAPLKVAGQPTDRGVVKITVVRAEGNELREDEATIPWEIRGYTLQFKGKNILLLRRLAKRAVQVLAHHHVQVTQVQVNEEMPQSIRQQ